MKPDCCPHKKRRQRHIGGKWHVKTRVGKRQTNEDRGRDWSYSPTNQETPEWPEARRTKERSVPYRISKEHGPADAWFWVSRFQSCERKHCFRLKPLSLWDLVTATLENQRGSFAGFRHRNKSITPGHSTAQVKKWGDLSFESLSREAVSVTCHIASYCKPIQKPMTSPRNKVTRCCLG